MKYGLRKPIQRIVAGSTLPSRLRYLVSAGLLSKQTPTSGVVEGYLGAYRMGFDLSDNIQRNVYLGQYDPVETRLVRRLLQPGDVFCDVGANIGYYSLLASQIVTSSGRVYAFEPIIENAAVLRRTVAANLVSNVVVNELAVGRCRGVVALYTGDVAQLGDSGWASCYASGNRSQVRIVQQIALDDYLQSARIRTVGLVKIDVEGMEFDVLSGMTRLLSQPDAPDLVCEVWASRSRDTVQCLAGHGYSLYAMPVGELLDPYRDLTDRITNLFCTKDSRRMVKPKGALAKMARYLE